MFTLNAEDKMFGRIFGKRNTFDTDRVFPQLLDSSLSHSHVVEDENVSLKIREGNKLIERNFVNGVDINVLYEMDQSGMSFVCHRDVEEWKSDEEFVFTHALQNLYEKVAINAKLKQRRSDDDSGQFTFVEGAGDFAASLALCDRFWSDNAIDRSQIALIVPHRSALAFTAGKSDKEIRILRELLSLYFNDPEEQPNRLILNGILVNDGKSNDAWKVLTPSASLH
jgi:hypothetical protein